MGQIPRSTERISSLVISLQAKVFILNTFMSNFVYSFLQGVRIARNADRCNSTGCLSVRLFVRLSRSVFCPDE